MPWYLIVDGQRRGPLRSESVAVLLDKGAIDGTTPAFREGLADWRPLADMPEFAAHCAPPPSTAPTPAATPSGTTPGTTPGTPAAAPAEPGWRQAVTERRGDAAAPSRAPEAAPEPEREPGPPPRRNYVVRHWRGELPLAQSYWINGLLLSLALGLALGGLGAWLGLRSLDADDPRPLLVAVLLLPLLALPLAPWQLVGLLRSARRTRRERGGVWAGIAIALAWLGVVMLAVQAAVLVSALPAALAGVDAGEAAPYALAISDDGARLRLSGPLAYGVTGTVRAALARHPQVDTIEFESVDGRGLAGLTLGRLIARGNFTTLVAGQCRGACAIAFFGGQRRVLDADGALGFTALAGSGVARLDRLALVAIVNFLREHGLDDAFVQQALGIENDQAWEPKPLELLAARAIRAVRIDGRLVGAGQYVEASAERLLDGLAHGAPFDALATHYPERWQRSRAMLRKVLLEEGRADTETPAFRSAQQREMRSAAIALLPTTSDEAALRYGRAYVHELQWLRRSHPEICVGAIYARGNDAADVESYADEATLAEHDAALRQLIEDARLRPSPPPREAEIAAGRASLRALIASRYPAPFLEAIRSRDGARAAEPLSVCVYEITVIDSTLKLPEDSAGRVLRSLAGGATL